MIELKDGDRVLEVGAGLMYNEVVIYIREAKPTGYTVIAKSPGMTSDEADELASMLKSAAAVVRQGPANE